MTEYWAAADTGGMGLYPPGWTQPWSWMHYHYYRDGEEVPVCRSPSASRSNGMETFGNVPPPEFLELFEDRGFGMHEPPMRVCKRCYKKLMETHR